MGRFGLGRFGVWVVFDIRVGRFGCSCGPFWTSTWAILDQAMGRFCPSRGPFWFMGRFGIELPDLKIS